jgi:malate dehydrogenase (oxaloacetate-decarboxylating)
MNYIETSLSGSDLINQPMLNKGTAFTDEERDIFGLHGLLPPLVGDLESQTKRRLRALQSLPQGFEQYAFLRELQDSNETLFYALLEAHVEQMLPWSTPRRWARVASASARSGASRAVSSSATP